VDGWIGMVAPTGTPPDIMLQVQENVAAAFREDATRARLKSLDLAPVANTPVEFAKELEQERETWKRVIARLGLTLE
jgi:tripartite-type tricarboxylate transporter receptor subunit TctC